MAKQKKVSSVSKKDVRHRFLTYWREHPNYTALVHTALGLGLGILAQGYVEAGYVNSVGYVLVLLGVVGHFYALVG